MKPYIAINASAGSGKTYTLVQRVLMICLENPYQKDAIRHILALTFTNNSITLQGNFDPARLHSSPEVIRKMVHEMIDRFGKDKYIANLGHGILPNIPLENAEAFIRAVVEWKG